MQDSSKHSYISKTIEFFYFKTYKIGLLVVDVLETGLRVVGSSKLGWGIGGADGNWSVVILLSSLVFNGISESDINAVSIARSTSHSCAVKYWRHISTESICVNS